VNRARPPGPVNVETEHVIQEVIPWGDLAEHSADTVFALISRTG
jgi:hypothetical protein